MKKIAALLFLILILVLFGCGKAETQQVQQDVSQPVVEETMPVEVEGTQESKVVVDNEISNEASKPTQQVKEFIVHGASFEYDKQEIRVKKGDRVKITYISDDIGHDLVIDEFGVRTNVVAKGQTEVVEFVADKVGEFTMYCSVGQHRQLGMESKLIVEA